MSLSEDLHIADKIRRLESIMLGAIKDEEPEIALAIISVMIDEYCALHDLNLAETWKMMFETAKFVRDTLGDCEYVKRRCQ